MNLPQLRSMTGFSLGKKSTSFGELSIEIQSLNRRFLDLTFYMPSSLSTLEISLRNLVQETIDRGALKIVIQVYRKQEAVKISVDYGLVKGYLEAWQKLQKDCSLKGEVDLSFLATQKGVFQVEDRLEETFFSDIKTLFLQVLEKLQEAKALEGQKIAKDLENRFEILKKHLEKIEILTKNSASTRLDELKMRMQRLIGQGFEDEKVIRQLAVLADNSDVTEEIVRFKSHLDHLFSWLKEPLKLRETKGKKLEFFIQELLREVNTLGSKALGSEISLLVIEMKSEIEKIKEQSQNIE